MLFGDSADKAARFIWTCNAFNVPLLFLADVPGFMIGTQVEREGIIRHGAKMISAVSEATVPKISVIVRKAYGAGLYAMAGPAFDPDCCLALPSASIAVMGPQAAINAVYYNQLQAIDDEDERAAGPRSCARVRGGHRHPASRLGAGGRRGDRARGAARRADPPLRAGGAARGRREWPATARTRHGGTRPSTDLSVRLPHMDATDIAYAGIARQAELIPAGEVSSRELVSSISGGSSATPSAQRLPAVFAERALLEADQADARRGPALSARCWACRSRSRKTPTSPAR